MKSIGMKKAIALSCIILLVNTLPVVAGQHTTTTANESNITMNSDTCIVVRNIYIGRIKDLDTNYSLYHINFTGNFTNYTAITFTAVRVVEISIYRYGLTNRCFATICYRNIRLFFPNNMYEFKGILRKNVICGTFTPTLIVS